MQVIDMKHECQQCQTLPSDHTATGFWVVPTSLLALILDLFSSCFLHSATMAFPTSLKN